MGIGATKDPRNRPTPAAPGTTMGDFGGEWWWVVSTRLGSKNVSPGLAVFRISPSAAARQQREDPNGVEKCRGGVGLNHATLCRSGGPRAGLLDRLLPGISRRRVSGSPLHMALWRAQRELSARAAMLHALGLEVTAPMTASEIVADPGYRGALPFIVAIPGPREPGVGTCPKATTEIRVTLIQEAQLASGTSPMLPKGPGL